MANYDNLKNGKLETGTDKGEGVQPGRCSIVQQDGPSRHHTTARDSGDFDGGSEGGRKRAQRQKEGRRRKVKETWTDEERRTLWECFVRSGGIRSGGYIQKVKEKWDMQGCRVRSVASLVSQLNQIEKRNLLTVMVREEIARRVKNELAWVGENNKNSSDESSSGESDCSIDMQIERKNEMVLELTEED